MKTISLIEGVVVAIALSVLSVAACIVSGLIYRGFCSVSLIVATCAAGYVLYLCVRSPRKIGRVTIAALTVILLLALHWGQATFGQLVICSLLILWLSRSLLYSSSLLMSLAHATLCGAGLIAATWAYERTWSFTFAVWTFFLVQAPFIYIPRRITRSSFASEGDIIRQSETFARAYRAADQALSRLVSRSV